MGRWSEDDGYDEGYTRGYYHGREDAIADVISMLKKEFNSHKKYNSSHVPTIELDEKIYKNLKWLKYHRNI